MFNYYFVPFYTINATKVRKIFRMCKYFCVLLQFYQCLFHSFHRFDNQLFTGGV